MVPPLPIDAVLPALRDALRESACVVLRAPTGSGKTTRVPPALLDAGLAGGKTIFMLEPRRVAARAAARRISFERGTSLGGETGYQVRFDQKVSRQTRIKIVTDGVLLRLLQDDPFLEQAGVVVFDEFHERSLNVDLALGMVRRVQQTVRPDLKIVVMSATLAAEPIARYLGGCPIVEAEGRLFPVAIHYLPQGATSAASGSRGGGLPVLSHVPSTLERALSESPGDVLVFLPGVGEIRRVADDLSNLAQRQSLAVMSLYGDLPAEQQDAVLTCGDRRKVVLSTNVAETSITIDGVTAVVDTGLARVLTFDAATGLDRLELSKISRASADQRAGRAGRTEPGQCYRLWGERDQLALAEQEEPEIRRIDLAGPVLELLCWGEPDALTFPWFEPPRETAVTQALSLLRRLEAIDDRGVTPIGRSMARLPVHPRLARMLIEGTRFGIPDRTALVAALLAERDPFLRERHERGGPRPEARHRSESDVVDRVVALEDFERIGKVDSDVGALNTGTARFVLRAREQLVRLLNEERRETASDAREVLSVSRRPMTVDEALRRAILCAFPDRVARRREPGSRRGLMVGGRGVRLWEKSAVAEAELFVCVDVDAAGTEALVRQASAIERDWLPGELLKQTEQVQFNEKEEKVVLVRRIEWDGLLLEESPLALPPNTDPARAAIDEQLAKTLAPEAAKNLDRIIPQDDSELQQFVARIRSLRGWMPELNLPSFDDDQMHEALTTLCYGCRSFADLRRAPWLHALKATLTPEQLRIIDRETPERLPVPSGNWITLHYEAGRPPVLAVRIQEMFGLAETPRVAGGRVPVLLHLLAPNMRPQQVTDDLKSFWNNTYQQVRKDLRRRYPKHSWPEDPWNAVPQKKPNRRPS